MTIVSDMRTTDKAKSTFSQRLIELRKEQGLTQEGLAELLGIARNRVAYYEAKATNTTVESIQPLADFFNVPVDYFFETDIKRSKPGPDSQLEQRINRLKKLPRAQQKTVIAMIDGVLDSFQKS